MPYVPYKELVLEMVRTFHQKVKDRIPEVEQEQFFDKIFFPRCLDAWARRSRRGRYSLSLTSMPIGEFNHGTHVLIWKFDSSSLTYDCVKSEKKISRPNIIPKKVPGTYAGAVTANMTPAHVEKLKNIHRQKLANSEYAEQFLKSGKIPKPLRKVTELAIVYTKIHKAEKGDIRRGLRSIGIGTEKVIDINFVGGSVTSLTIPKAEIDELKSKLSSKDLWLEDFNPLSEEASKYCSYFKEPIARYLDRLNVAKKIAEDGGKVGLKNFYCSIMANNAVDFHNKRHNLELEEQENAKKRRDFSRMPLDKLKGILLDETVLPDGPMGLLIGEDMDVDPSKSS